MLKEARKHLRFCVRLYRHQMEQGRYFLHEHPLGAKSWKEPEIQALVKKEKSILAKIDQCQYGLWVKDRVGWAVAKKPTKFLTNCPRPASGCFAPRRPGRLPLPTLPSTRVEEAASTIEAVPWTPDTKQAATRTSCICWCPRVWKPRWRY